MSDLSGAKRALPNIADLKRVAMTRRAAVYAGVALVAVLVLAWIDGGEEPLRPIVQHIASPVANGGAS